MMKINIADGKVDKEDVCYFTTKAAPIQTEADITGFIDNIGKKLDSSIEKYTTNGSNWVVAGIENIALRLVKYRLLRGGAAGTFQLPRELAKKKCVLNIDSQNNECFKYAIIAALHHAEIDDQHNKNRRINYDRFVANYDFSTVTYPATAQDIQAFMKVNPKIAINALLYTPATDEKKANTVSIYHPPHKQVIKKRMANILLVNDHWSPITSLDRLQ